MLISKALPRILVTTINDLHPGTAYQPRECANSARQASSTPNKPNTSPIAKLNFRGILENEVAAVQAKVIIFRKGYLVSPAARSRRRYRTALCEYPAHATMP